MPITAMTVDLFKNGLYGQEPITVSNFEDWLKLENIGWKNEYEYLGL